jgi:hypothetical protein
MFLNYRKILPHILLKNKGKIYSFGGQYLSKREKVKA